MEAAGGYGTWENLLASVRCVKYAEEKVYARPVARLHVWGVQGTTLRAFSGSLALTSRNASQGSEAIRMIWRLEEHSNHLESQYICIRTCMLPSRFSSPCLGGASSPICSIFWECGSNELKHKSMKWCKMEDLALGRTFQPLVVPIYMCKNRFSPVP